MAYHLACWCNNDCLGGFWFWFFLRVDVYSEANPWYRIIKADLFVLALLASASFGV
ncbi:MAG: hypothetical protein CM1200mP5_6040 [Candidatus Pelagibacterales bacterium]|nr:MAG: hypothetical protein CM1200mP5_6040 [Pelagibacterales bacterium]